MLDSRFQRLEHHNSSRQQHQLQRANVYNRRLQAVVEAARNNSRGNSGNRTKFVAKRSVDSNTKHSMQDSEKTLRTVFLITSSHTTSCGTADPSASEMPTRQSATMF